MDLHGHLELVPEKKFDSTEAAYEILAAAIMAVYADEESDEESDDESDGLDGTAVSQQVKDRIMKVFNEQCSEYSETECMQIMFELTKL